MKIQLVAKFEKKTDGLLSRISPNIRTNGRTGLIAIVPFRLKSGTNKEGIAGIVETLLQKMPLAKRSLWTSMLEE